MTRQKLFFAVVLCAVCATGCTSTRQVDLDSPEATETIRTINEGSQHKKAKVEFADRQRTAARSLMIAPDTTSWMNGSGSAMRFATPTHDLRRVQFNRRGQGAMEGLAMGALAGVAGAFGMLLSSQEFSDASRGVQLIIPLSGLAGIFFGALRGNRRTYVFTPTAPPPLLPMPPVVAEAPPVVEQETAAEPPPVVEEPAEDMPMAEAPAVEEDPVAEEAPAAAEEAPIIEEAPAIEETPGPAPEPVLFDREQVSWTVVLSSHADQASADADVARYREQYGATGYPIDVVMDGGQYRVIVGQFKTLAEAQTAQQSLSDLPPTAWLFYFQPQ